MKVYKKIIRIIFYLLLGIVLIASVYFREYLDLRQWQQLIETKSFAPLIFMLIYVFATVLFMPGALLTLAGGALFGPVYGTLYSLTGATVGALFAFLLSRYLFADWFRQSSGKTLKHLSDGVSDEGWRFIAFVRLVPLFPFNLINYLLGLTRISTLHYFFATWICMLPGAFAYSWIGYTGLKAATGQQGWFEGVLIMGGIVLVLIYLPHFIKQLRTKA